MWICGDNRKILDELGVSHLEHVIRVLSRTGRPACDRRRSTHHPEGREGRRRPRRSHSIMAPSFRHSDEENSTLLIHIRAAQSTGPGVDTVMLNPIETQGARGTVRLDAR